MATLSDSLLIFTVTGKNKNIFWFVNNSESSRNGAKMNKFFERCQKLRAERPETYFYFKNVFIKVFHYMSHVTNI